MSELRRSPPIAAAVASSPSVAALLSVCGSLRSLEKAHSLIVKKGLEQQSSIALRFLSLCGTLSAAPSYSLFFFRRLSSPSLPHTNALIAAHAHFPSAAFALFASLRRSIPFAPDAYTFAPLLRSLQSPAAGAALHYLALLSGLLPHDPFVATALIAMYSRFARLTSAHLLFDEIPRPNAVAWTAIITSHIKNQQLLPARRLFDAMPHRNPASYNAIINGYVKNGDLVTAHQLFDEMPRSQRNRLSFTTLIDGYAKSGDMASARCLFDELKERDGDLDLFSWSAMIFGYSQNGFPGEALNVFLEMYEKGVHPDGFILVGLMSSCTQLGSAELAGWVDSYVFRSSVDQKGPHVLAALVDMHAKCGNMDRASALFDSMPARDLVTYCSMMQGYTMHGLGEMAVKLFSRMLAEEILPDHVAFTVVLTACSHSGLVAEGECFFHMMRNKYTLHPSSDHYACMVDLLGRRGRVVEAYALIESMPLAPHAGAWGALLGACRLHGHVELGEVVAKKLFEIEPLNGGNYVALSNIYAAADKWADVSRLRTMMRGRCIRKVPGCTWV